MQSPLAIISICLMSAVVLSCHKSSAPSDVAAPVRALADLPIENKAFAAKTPELARFGLEQAAHALMTFNFALGYRLVDRMVIEHANESLIYGCRLVNKVSPSYARRYDTNNENLEVRYVRCGPELLNGSEVANADLEGEDDYFINYDKPYPRKTAPELELGWPTSINVKSSPLNIELSLRSGAKLHIARNTVLIANLDHTEGTAPDGSGGVNIYDLQSRTTDTYEQDDAGVIVRHGTVSTNVSGYRLKVPRNGDRVVSEVSAGSIEVVVDGEKVAGVASAAQLAQSVPEAVDLQISATGALKLADSSCDLASGAYQIIATDGHALNMSVADDSVTIDGADPRVTRLCDDPNDVWYLDEFESAFW